MIKSGKLKPEIFLIILVFMVFFNVEAGFCAFTSPATDITATTQSNGSIFLEWVGATTDGDPPAARIRYEIYRKRLDAGTYARITDSLQADAPNTEFLDKIDANDPGTNGNDNRMDGTSPDSINQVWGHTYQYYILARDDNEAPGTSTHPANGSAAVIAAHCDDQGPQLEVLNQGPEHEGFAKAEQNVVRVSMNYVDWTDLTGLGAFKVLWKIDGGATQGTTATMNRVSGGYPNATILEGVLDLTGAANGSSVQWWISGQDNHLNPMQSILYTEQLTTDSVYLLTVDNNGPLITDSLYIDFANDGISANDQWIVRFDEDVKVTSELSVFDFTLGPTVGGTFGTSASLFHGPLTNEVTIVLGSNPNLKFVGGSLINQINYRGSPLTTIMDMADNIAQNTAYTVVARPAGNDLPDAPRPKLTTAEFTDINEDAVFNNPDTLKITFDKPIGLFNTTPTGDYTLPVTGDGLGTTPTQSADAVNRKILWVTLGNTAAMRVVGEFNSGSITAGSSSGIDGAPATTIVDDFGNTIEQKTPNAGIDIVGTDTTQPTVISSIYTDTISATGIRDGMSGGDRLKITFDRGLHAGLTPFVVNALNAPVGNDNLDSPTFTINPANLKELFVDFSSAGSLTIHNQYNGTHTLGNPSGVDVASGSAAACFVDIYGNAALATTAKDIASDDTDGPRIAPVAANANAVLYTDNDGNGPDQGDFIDVEFDEPIIFLNPLATDFQTNNLNFGIGASFAVVETTVNNRKIRITLGVTPSVTTTGASRSQLDLVNNTSRIKNWADLNARSDGFRNVEAASALGPQIVTAQYTDNGNNGLNIGDIIILTFDKQLVLNIAAISAADFQLPVTSDTLGAGVTFSNTGLNNTQLRITLGNSPILNIGGIFNIASTTNNSASGIDIVNGGTADIQDTFGNNSRPKSPAGVDIEPTDANAPTLTAVDYTDIGSDGFTMGDQLLLTFSEPITCGIPPAGNALRNLAFNLPVQLDALGQDPVTVINPQPASNQIRIQFITAPVIKVAGLYNGNIAAGVSSGMDISPNMPSGMITDISGNSAVPNSGTVGVNGIIDIGSTDVAAPTLVSVQYTDVDKNGPDEGDILELTFSEPILVNALGVAPQASNFNVTNGTLGTDPDIEAASTATDNVIVKITLGASASLDFSPPSAATATIDVAGTITSITDISGNGAISSTAKTISSTSTDSPYVISSWFSDNDANGLDQGDTISVVFNKDIQIGAVTIADFQLPATDNGLKTDSFGTGVLFTRVDSRTIEITIGTDPELYIPGAYSGPLGKSSGIDIATAGSANIVDMLNNSSIARITGPVDIGTTDLFGPEIVESYWSDANASGSIDSGDTVSVRFDMPIYLGTNISPASFNLPVAGDTINFSSAVLSGTDTIYLTLSNPLVLTVGGVFDSLVLAAGSPTGIDVSNASFPSGSISSHSGVNAMASNPVDLFSGDDTGPVVLAAEYEDLNRNSTVDTGDIVNIMFSENITLNNPVIANFNLHNCSFGTTPTLAAGGGGNILRITLDAGATITLLGDDTSSVDVISVIPTITDFSGNGAGQTTQKFITIAGTADGPKILSALWNDAGAVGVSQGDTLMIGFNKDIAINSVDVNDFSLPVTGDGFGTGALFSLQSPRTIEVILGTTPAFQPIGIFNAVNTAAGDPSGIDISAAGSSSGHIVDSFGYLAEANSPAGIDISSSDDTGPVLISAVFNDIDFNGVDGGDTIELMFNETIIVDPTTVSAGNFIVTNGNFGTGATFSYDAAKPASLTVILGTGPAVKVGGVFPGDAGSTGIDLNNELSNITDVSGQNAHSNNGVDLTPVETDGPTVTGATYLDTNSTNALDVGDYVYVRFNEVIQFDSVTFNDFTTPVQLDSIGGAPVFSAGRDTNEIRIQLGSAPVLTPSGAFRVGVIATGSASGIDVINTTHITDVYGNSARASVSKDIDDGQGPWLTGAVYTDVDGNAVDEGDTIVLSFSEAITINNPVATDFMTLVNGDSLGAPVTFIMGAESNEVILTLGTGAFLTIANTYNPLTATENYPSGINLATTYVSGHILDLAGNNVVQAATGVDITGSDTTQPTLTGARWVDNGNTGVGAGDHIILTLSKVVTARNILNSDYYFPVAQNSIGAPISIEPNDVRNFTNEITIVLGYGANITVPGTYTSGQDTAGQPSGIAISPSFVAGHMYDVYGNPPVNSSVIDIAGADGTGPVVLSCSYWDLDNNGPDQGDLLGVNFDKPVQFRNSQAPAPAEFRLPVNGNSFGTSPVITAGTTSNDIRIYLGENPVLTIPGVFTDTTDLNDTTSPSGLRATGTPTGNLIDFSGNTPTIVPDTASVDLVPSSTVGPTLLTVTINDSNGNFVLDQNDRMTLIFDRAIAIQGGFNPATNLSLPVAGNGFGTGATFEVNAANRTQLYIGLGAGPSFNVEGIYNSSNTTAGSPSGVGIPTGTTTITDLGGLPVNGDTTRDIADEYRPFIVASTYTDTANDGLGSGDFVIIRFNEEIQTSNLTITDIALSGAGDTFGTGTTFQQITTDSIRLVLGNSPVLTVAGVYPVDATATGIDISTTFNNGHIRDTALNSAIRTVFKDISPVDQTAPTVVSSVYGDVNGNGLIDGGDTISVFLSNTVYVNGAVRTDFSVVNGDLGTGGNETVIKGTATNEVIITLGATPILTVEGIYPTDAGASAIDIGAGYVAGHITTISGTNPLSSTPKDIADLLGPVIVTAVFTDSGINGVGQGDFLDIGFNRNVLIGGTVNASGFFFPVNGNTLGNSTVFTLISPTVIRITLGENANLRVSGVYSDSNTGGGFPSGINISQTVFSNITDSTGNQARTALTAIDITGTDVTAPNLLTAVYNDKDGNGVGEGDEIKLTFDEPVFFDQAISPSDFSVANGSLGTNPIFRTSTTSSRELIIVLGQNSAISLFGSSQTSIGRADTTYLTGHITDVTGNDWGTGVQTAVTTINTASPTITGAVFSDVDNLGLGAGDVIVLRFSVPVVLTASASVSDFKLPVAGDNFGGSATVTAGTTNREVNVVLGIGAKITVAGIFSPSLLVLGSPTGIDIDVTSTNITSIGGDAAKANSIAVDVTSTDTTYPSFISANLTGNYGTNLIKAQSDTVTITATLDDPSLKSDSIFADLTAIGGGNKVAASTYLGNVASWNAIATANLRDSVEIQLSAIDIAGNTGNYMIRANIIQPAKSVTVEYTPNQVLRNSGVSEFTAWIKADVPDYATGFNTINIDVPVSGPLAAAYYYTDVDITATTVLIGNETLNIIQSGTPSPSEALVTYNTISGRIKVLLGKVLTSASLPTAAIRVSFKAKVPEYSDEPDGKKFTVSVDNSNDSVEVTASGGDVDGTATNGNTDSITVIGIKIQNVDEDFVITPNFWKIIFTIKFNSNMDIEQIPVVTFKPVNSLMNELNVTQLSFVDSTWMGQAIVPFENFGFSGDYTIKVSGAKDYIGSVVNILEHTKSFSSTFLISSYIHPSDERTLVVSTRYNKTSTDAVLLNKPMVKITQTGTEEASLITVFETQRADTYIGNYIIDKSLGGNAQIEVEGYVGPSGTKVTGKATTEFSTIFMNSSTGGTVSSPDKYLTVDIPPKTFSRSHQVTIIPDLSDQFPVSSGQNLYPKAKNSSPAPVELERVSPVYMTYPEGASFVKDGFVSLSSMKIDVNADNIGLFVMGAEGWEFIGKTKNNNKVIGKITKLGRFALFRDVKGPELKLPEDEGQEYEKEFLFDAEDNGCGIDMNKTRIYLDGNLVSARLIKEDNKILVNLPSRMVQGTHELSGEIVDNLGNVSSLGKAPLRAAGFMDVINIMPYPNPARFSARIRYTLGKTMTELKIKIYDGSGRTVHVMDNFAAGALTAGAHDTNPWILTNDHFTPVANGVYFFRIIARDGSDKKIIKTGKIAVLR